jgi:CubicO group peptidase (beta-lactamase class C family)
MAKSFVSMAVGAALKDGFIKSLEDPISDYLPWYSRPDDRQKVRIKHLLTMSSGIAFDEHYLNPLAFPARANYGDHLQALVQNYRPLQPPGEVFDYQSGNTQLLAFIVEAATGKTLSAYFSEKIWQPIGASQTAFWSLDREQGMEKGFCCFNSNARDFARIGRLFLDSGLVDGQQILPSEYIASAVSRAPLREADGTPCMRYGYQWWIWNYKDRDIFYARGIKGQYIICIPDLNTVVVRLGHKRKKPEGYEPPPEFFTLVDIAINQVETRNKGLSLLGI